MNKSGITFSNLKKAPPLLCGGLPYLGHALEFYRNPTALLQQGQEQLGDIFSFLLLGTQVTFMSGSKANEAFFRAPDNLLSTREVYKLTTPIFGKGLAYDTTPEMMSEQLGFVMPLLREERLQAYASLMVQEAQVYFESWDVEGQVDLLSVMNELTLIIACRCLIGREFRQRLSTEFPRLYRDLEGGLNFLAFFYPYLPLPSFKKRDKARIRVVELISQILAERKAREDEDENLLQTLMTAQYKDGSYLSDDNITGILLTLLFAAKQNTAVLATWTGILLLQNPQYLPVILQEQQQILGNGKEVSLNALRQLVALERSIKEAERMYPPIIMLMRKILRDFEYEEYCIPSDGLLMISPAVTHRIADIFHEPNRYDPDRFSPGREEDRKAIYSLIGFGGGRHRCIGQTFAYQQIKVIWSTLLRLFDLELVYQNYEPDYSTLVVGPQKPCLVRYRRKNIQ
ncbi:cytochrome P450 [Nostoc sp. UHCC 0251]|uniref:cytochrome P450 n=1 Tax=Nostoc sp. UHCC 0251 TaxID=3110240 RepID=UPI002B212DCE|nr:cytochrome P450 [Nostoc sp. UHCC 0251]MEA5622439.1 cytochrome P450 [Nostoc sp. UHCC 0251]